MDIITAAGRSILGRASQGTAIILRIVSFFTVWKASQIIVNNIITNSDGFAARGINAVDYAPYDASWLVGQVEGVVSLRGEFFIIAFMNSAFQFLLSALIAYELASTKNEWCPPMKERVVNPNSIQELSFVQRIAYYVLPVKTSAHSRITYTDGYYTFGPINTIIYYAIPQGLSLRSRHVRANANRSALLYLGLWILLAVVDVWATTMFRIKMPTGLDYSLLWVAIATSIIYNIVLAELALLISGGIAVATIIDIVEWLWGNGKSLASTAKKKPAVTVTNNEPRTPATNSGGQRNQQTTPNMPLRDKNRNSGSSQQPVVRSTSSIGNGRTPTPAFASSRSVDDLFSREGIRPTFEFGEED